MQALLVEEGVDLHATPFLEVWRLFTRFAEVPVRAGSDGLLYEWIIFERVPDEFSIHFLRQLEGGAQASSHR